ncbi:MAG: hypothetical protein K8S54_13800 [Spirochaetia bacterium]|nr:hypothetical protein [Spirochaetia bacterium]
MTAIARPLVIEFLRILICLQGILLLSGRTSGIYLFFALVCMGSWYLYWNRVAIRSRLETQAVAVGIQILGSLIIAVFLIRYTEDPAFPVLSRVNPWMFLSLHLLLTLLYFIFSRKQQTESSLVREGLVGLLTLSLFVFYLSNDTRLVSADTRGNALLPFTLLNGNLALDEFVGSPRVQHDDAGRDLVARDHVKVSSSNALGHLLVATPAGPTTESGYILHPYYLVPRNGKFYSIFPILPGLVNTAVLAALKGSGLMEKYIQTSEPANAVGVVYDQSFRLQRITAALLAAISAVLLFSLLANWLSDVKAFLLALLFAIGSAHYSTSSQGIWQHGVGEILVLGICAMLLQPNKPRTHVITGLLLSLLVATRPSNAPLAIVFAAGCLLQSPRSVFPLALGALPVILALGIFNTILFGNLAGGYGLLRGSDSNSANLFGFLGNPLSGGAGLLFSPGRGLFFYTPFLFFAALGAYIGRRQRLIQIAAAGIGVHVIAFALVPFWWGGACVGPRYLVEILPLFFILLFPLVEAWKNARVVRTLFFTLALASIVVQLLLVLSERPFVVWNSNPHINSNPERLWSFRYPPFRETLHPFAPALFASSRFYSAFEEAQRDLFEEDVIRSSESESGYLRVKTDIKTEGVWIVLKMPLYLRRGSYTVTIRTRATSKSGTELKLVTEGESSLAPISIAIPESDGFQLVSTKIAIQKSSLKSFSILAKSNATVVLDYIEVTKDR